MPYTLSRLHSLIVCVSILYIIFRHNIAVALLFIYHWLSGSGVFYYNGSVEDSATAEISRSQLWQWIRFSVDKILHFYLIY